MRQKLILQFHYHYEFRVNVIPYCWFKNAFLSYFGTEISQSNFHKLFRERLEHTLQFLIEAFLHITIFILCWGINAHKNGMKLATS
jgi:hypothetical protein